MKTAVSVGPAFCSSACKRVHPWVASLLDTLAANLLPVRLVGRVAPLRRAPTVVCAALLLAGCADTAYLVQSVKGHLHLLSAARPVDDWLADPLTPEALRHQLHTAQAIRGYAANALALPDNASYRRYADLQRSAVVWNVVATPAYSLVPKTWCFPVTGCIAYRGYFDEAAAQTEATALRAQGLEVTVYGVPAYSTLGWSNWVGGDPLLNTFVGRGDAELARLLFHELAHQVLYVQDDTVFNESFATAVERIGLAQWLAHTAAPAQLEAHKKQEARRAEFRELSRSTRTGLQRIYEQIVPAEPMDVRHIAIKKEAFENFRVRYAALRASWGVSPGQRIGYDAWVEHANNASFAAVASYDTLVPGFEALFRRETERAGAADGGVRNGMSAGRSASDWQRFYDAVKQLAQLPQPQRTLALTTPITETPGGHSSHFAQPQPGPGKGP